MLQDPPLTRLCTWHRPTKMNHSVLAVAWQPLASPVDQQSADLFRQQVEMVWAKSLPKKKDCINSGGVRKHITTGLVAAVYDIKVHKNNHN